MTHRRFCSISQAAMHGLVIAVIVSGIACSESPVAPGVITNAPALRIGGPASVAPGTTVAYTATMRRADGSSIDVTALATWTSSDPAVLEVKPGGLVIGTSRGEATISATYQELKDEWSVPVLDTGTFKLAGRVIEAGLNSSLGIRGATVEVVRGVGLGLRATTAELGGGYVLYGVAGDIQLKVSAVGYKTATFDLRIEEPVFSIVGLVPDDAVESLLGRWRMTVTAAACPELPVSARSREFILDLSNMGSRRLLAKISSSSIRFTDALIGQVIEGEMVLPVPYDPGNPVDGPYYGLLDTVPPQGTLGIRGVLHARADGPSASGRFDGAFDYYAIGIVGVGGVSCAGRGSVVMQREVP